MAVISLPAAKVQQGELTIYASAIKVSVLLENNFYSVETLDPSEGTPSGFQRLLNEARARRLAEYIVRGQDTEDAFLPTSLFLATDKPLSFEPSQNLISFETSEVCPFSVVDGQHRLEGLKMAAERDSRVLEFEMPVNIASRLPHLHQMCHFLIVNTTQKSVDRAVEQRIVARLTKALDVEKIPVLPKWIKNLVEKGEVDKAIQIVDFLNEENGSPWKDKVRMANDPPSNKLNQQSFVKAIVKYVLTANNPISSLGDFDKEKRIFLNYWKAVSKIIDNGKASVLYKYNGVELFCRFSNPFFNKLFRGSDFTVDTMIKLLNDCFDNIEDENEGVRYASWWSPGGKASGLNVGAITQVAHAMTKALHQQSMAMDIEL